MDDLPVRMDIFQTALPIRAFEHAAATRKVSEAIVVRLVSRAGRVGWGETLPRPYVTGETLETVPRDLEAIFWPILRACRDERELRQVLAELPSRHEGRVVTAARCAAELAAIQLLDVTLPGPVHPSTAWPPVTGVLGSANPSKTARKLRLMRWYGLRHFKLKLGLGDEIDRANLAAVYKQIGPGIPLNRYSLRVDVNSAWRYADVPARAEELKRMGVLAIEQPCKVARVGQLAELAYKCPLPLIADESLLTESDAEVLLGAEGRVWLNIRISKNGGIGPAARMAELAHRDGIPFVLGCMVGESGILSAAQRALLSSAPPPIALEGNYGRFLLKVDLTRPSPRFGYRGTIYQPADKRFNPHVRPDRLERYATLVATLTA